MIAELLVRTLTVFLLEAVIRCAAAEARRAVPLAPTRNLVRVGGERAVCYWPATDEDTGTQHAWYRPTGREVTNQPRRSRLTPRIGRIAAGIPALAEEPGEAPRTPEPPPSWAAHVAVHNIEHMVLGAAEA
ncbi:hypothetical protein GCM10018780_77870 [Streptomyces lanatus]|nr:hypothetical protein GCM10018780_77870 [Streptomyces lanatus]